MASLASRFLSSTFLVIERCSRMGFFILLNTSKRHCISARGKVQPLKARREEGGGSWKISPADCHFFWLPVVSSGVRLIDNKEYNFCLNGSTMYWQPIRKFQWRLLWLCSKRERETWTTLHTRWPENHWRWLSKQSKFVRASLWFESFVVCKA